MPVPIKFFSNEGYFAVITATSDLMTVMTYGFKSESLIKQIEVSADNAMTFLDSVATIFDASKCKAIILDIFSFKPTGFSHVMIFAQELRCKFADNKLCNFFYSGENLFNSGMLVSAKIKSSKNDSILCIRVGTDQLYVFKYIFTDMGYDLIRENLYEEVDKESSFKLREKILRGTNPKHIIVYGEDLDAPIMRKLKKVVFFNETINLLDGKMLKESVAKSKSISKFVSDRSIVKYHINNARCQKDFAVYLDDMKNPLFVVQAGETLPVHNVDCVRRSADKLFVCSFDEDTKEKRIIFIHKLEDGGQNCHRKRITFFVDKESFPSIQSVPIILDVIKQLPQKLDETYAKKIPVIVFRDTYSVICAVKKGQRGYSFLDGWNGIYGHDDAMFVKKSQQLYGFEATKMKKLKPNHTLTNMLEIMSQTDLSAIEDPVFCKDYFKEHTSFKRGYDREDIVCFYMTKFLEEHFKVIHDETGVSVDEVGFYIEFPEKQKIVIEARFLKSFKTFDIHPHLLDLPK
uniref:Uncharacterized protein n=1 Tax=Panagrolaimus sp. ES5 TaxID=591445 RepID=A0AC34FJL8_9BILA